MIVWHTVANPSADLQRVTDAITSDRGELASRGIELTSWGPDPALGKVRIVLTQHIERAATDLLRRYGSALVSVGPRSVPRMELTA